MRYLMFISISLFFSAGLSGQGANTYMPTNLYMFNTLMINPGYAGVKESFSASAMYSKYWMGFEGNNDVQVIAGHTPLRNNRIALGFLAENSRFGLRNYTNAYAYYNYRLEVGGGRLGMGLRAGANYYINNLSGADLPQPDDPAFVNDPMLMPNVGVGFYYYSNLVYAGFSVPSLLAPNKEKRGFTSYYRDYNLTFIGGMLFTLSDNFKIKPSTYVKYVPSTGLEKIDYHINTSFILFNDVLWLGGSYKANGGIVGILEFQVTQQIRMGYAYEFPTGDLQTFSNGVHEFLLRYDFAYIIRAVNPGFFW